MVLPSRQSLVLTRQSLVLTRQSIVLSRFRHGSVTAHAIPNHFFPTCFWRVPVSAVQTDTNEVAIAIVNHYALVPPSSQRHA